MFVFIVLVLALVAVVWRARRRRKAVLAGRDGAKPIYQVSPPSRRLVPRASERL